MNFLLLFQLKKLSNNKGSTDNILLKSLEDENAALKNKITLLELDKPEKKSDINSKMFTY